MIETIILYDLAGKASQKSYSYHMNKSFVVLISNAFPF